MTGKSFGEKVVKNLPALITGIIYCTLMAWLHYRQACVTVSSDMPIYLLEIQGVDTGYSFPYPLFFKSAAFLSMIMPVEPAVTAVLTVFNLISFFAMYYWLLKKAQAGPVKALAVTLVTHLVSMIFWPLNIHSESTWYNFRYLGVFTPNPYQNATYIAARPFAFLLFAKYHDIENGDRELKNYIFLSVWLLLSVLAKPSFALIFLPVMGIVTLVGFLKNVKGYPHIIKMFIAVLPACIALLVQYLSVFDAGAAEDGGIHIGFAVVWHLWTKGIRKAFIMANLFPVVFALLHPDEFKKEKILRYAWYAYLAGFSSFVFLYEGGFRMNDANFAWGYMHGMFFVFFASAYILFKRLFSKESRFSVRDGISLAALIPHLVCGILFFVFVLEGGSVYTF